METIQNYQHLVIDILNEQYPRITKSPVKMGSTQFGRHISLKLTFCKTKQKKKLETTYDKFSLHEVLDRVHKIPSTNYVLPYKFQLEFKQDKNDPQNTTKNE